MNPKMFCAVFCDNRCPLVLFIWALMFLIAVLKLLLIIPAKPYLWVSEWFYHLSLFQRELIHSVVSEREFKEDMKRQREEAIEIEGDGL